MNIFSIFSLMSFLNSMKPEPPRRPSKVSLTINELSDELDYYIDKYRSFRNRVR